MGFSYASTDDIISYHQGSPAWLRSDMVKQRSKSVLLKDIQAEHRQLERILAGLGDAEIIQPGVVGDWSVKDILAHLTAWEKLFLSWYESGIQGRDPDQYPVGMSVKAIDSLNQQIYNRYREMPLEVVLTDFQISYQQLLTTVNSIPEENMFTQGCYPWTGKLTLADYLAGNTCNHYRWARTKIRRWRKDHD